MDARYSLAAVVTPVPIHHAEFSEALSPYKNPTNPTNRF